MLRNGTNDTLHISYHRLRETDLFLFDTKYAPQNKAVQNESTQIERVQTVCCGIYENVVNPLIFQRGFPIDRLILFCQQEMTKSIHQTCFVTRDADHQITSYPSLLLSFLGTTTGLNGGGYIMGELSAFGCTLQFCWGRVPVYKTHYLFRSREIMILALYYLISSAYYTAHCGFDTLIRVLI